MKLNLHELINHPGYGKANEAVKEAGFWLPAPLETLWQAYRLANQTGATDVADMIECAAMELDKEEPQS